MRTLLLFCALLFVGCGDTTGGSDAGPGLDAPGAAASCVVLQELFDRCCRECGGEPDSNCTFNVLGDEGDRCSAELDSIGGVCACDEDF